MITQGVAIAAGLAAGAVGTYAGLRVAGVKASAKTTGIVWLVSGAVAGVVGLGVAAVVAAKGPEPVSRTVPDRPKRRLTIGGWRKAY